MKLDIIFGFLSNFYNIRQIYRSKVVGDITKQIIANGSLNFLRECIGLLKTKFMKCKNDTIWEWLISELYKQHITITL